MCLRIVSTKCVNRMKARAIRPLCWPPPNKFISIRESVRQRLQRQHNTTQCWESVQQQLQRRGNNIDNILDTLASNETNSRIHKTKPSCFIFFINALQWLRGVNEIFVWKSFAFPLFQLVENMILCKSGKYWKEIDALERNWGNRWCSDIDGTFMHRILNQSPPYTHIDLRVLSCKFSLNSKESNT